MFQLEPRYAHQIEEKFSNNVTCAMIDSILDICLTFFGGFFPPSFDSQTPEKVIGLGNIGKNVKIRNWKTAISYFNKIEFCLKKEKKIWS